MRIFLSKTLQIAKLGQRIIELETGLDIRKSSYGCSIYGQKTLRNGNWYREAEIKTYFEIYIDDNDKIRISIYYDLPDKIYSFIKKNLKDAVITLCVPVSELKQVEEKLKNGKEKSD